MIPMIDLLVKSKIEMVLNQLSKNPRKIREYFEYASNKTMDDMVRLITEYEISVLSGYPREQTQLPCIIVSIGGEEEVEYGLSGGIDEAYEDLGDNYLKWDSSEDRYILANTQMRIQIRAEVWSDNAVITSFLYAIVKYCLLTVRFEMEKEGIILSNISGGDLEPAPEYFPIFVYRKATILSCEYTIRYHVGNQAAGKEDSQFNIGTTIDDIEIELKEGREVE